MSTPTVDDSMCSACGTCVDSCPNGCYDLMATAVMARPDDCTECGVCVDDCPSGAISME
jgi:NAD-dependent dihydropyrimidine dehydrogenase PreA subunit